MPYYVRAATRVQTGGFGISDPKYLDDNTGNVQALSIESGPFTVTSTSANYATATAYSLSELGSLKGYGSISASSTGAAASADAQITGAVWSDTITVTSDTLPLGTLVNLEATLTFHRELSASSPTVLAQTSASVTGPFSLSISDTLAAPNSTQSQTATFSAYVGYPFVVTAQLYFQINGAVSNGSVSGDIDVSNTATFQLVSLNPAASYSTASGVNYVPEPTALALVSLGCIALITRRRP